MEAKIVIGVCMGPKGLQGDIKVKSHSGETGHFRKLKGQQVELRSPAGQSRLITVVAATAQGPLALLRFENIDSPEQVHSFIGWEVWTDRKFAAGLADDEYYIADLVGCTVRYNGQDAGLVKHVWSSGAADMLEVETADKRLLNVPFQAPFIGAVHIKERWIELLTDWILE